MLMKNRMRGAMVLCLLSYPVACLLRLIWSLLVVAMNTALFSLFDVADAIGYAGQEFTLFWMISLNALAIIIALSSLDVRKPDGEKETADRQDPAAKQ